MASATDIHENRQETNRTLSIAMTALGLFFVILRLLARWKKGLSIGRDDYTMLLSVVFLFATCGLNLTMIHYGMGRHAAVLPTENVMTIAKLLMAFECVYCTTVGIIKVSILLMYARIFPTRNFRIASIILGGIAIGWVIAIICVSVFQCDPIAKAWNPSLPGTCINLKGSFIGNAVPNIVTDVAILSLPVHAVWGLHASLTHRLSVIAIFLLGSFVVFTSAYRFSTLFQFEPADTTWTLAKACTWCLIECSSGIISACLPTLRPLFVALSSKFASSVGTSRGRTTGTSGIKGSELQSFDGMNPVLRPANEYLAKQQVSLQVSRRDTASEDEVPLNTIRVQRDISWQETRKISNSRRWR
ncbi:uncharacterized protein BO97DRAFT_442171 [Aspergillus homomorphus CBS 101889]|uniref:Rhodopsin domain-containing protein n=1 Tax=Aspergillus homomorphus (strain CBS 101889) TaxID=1450537 RepID=A0A395I1R3_ASPHC|nr:hypothetical protein BO97DRAFT_442171 [Aspergillus homomorphus CBS 101889]RAL13867.1 hypothetical protein BO97DRAFT_442171 [Aspergillus homomorphus CBS 101889]